METSQLITILRTFQKPELKKFRNMINSPFHNSNKNLVKLFNVICKYSPEYKNPGLKKEKIYAKIFPSKKYDDQIMRNLIYGLLKLTRSFLTLQELGNSSFDNLKYLLRAYKQRNIDVMFEDELKKAFKELENSKKNADYFYKNFILNEIRSLYNEPLY